MTLKRLIIKNFGEIDELEYVPSEIMNSVSRTVANAISIVLNNQFAVLHYNTVELSENSYLYAEILDWQDRKKVVYTVTYDGFAPAVYTKNGEKMTDAEVDGDKMLTRPYREDNTCLFVARKKSDFLDYFNFLPSYFKRLKDYSESFKEAIGLHTFLCNVKKNYYVKMEECKVTVWRRDPGAIYKRILDLSECDELCVRYSMFLLIAQMIDYHHQTRCNNVVTRTPVIVDGLVSGLDADMANIYHSLAKMVRAGRQAFFVEKEQEPLKQLFNKVLQ